MIAPMFSASHSAKWERGTLQQARTHDGGDGQALAGPSTNTDRSNHARHASEPTWNSGTAGPRRETKKRRTRFQDEANISTSGRGWEPSGPTARVELGAAFASRLSEYQTGSALSTPRRDVDDEWRNGWDGAEQEGDDEAGFRWEKTPAGSSAMPGEGDGACRCCCHASANGKAEPRTRVNGKLEMASNGNTKAITGSPKTYSWVSGWFLLTAPVIFWDASYCLLRPRSMVGGDLHWIWEPYSIYQEVDWVYGVKALEENNGFTSAQSFMNIVETLMNIAYVYLAHTGWAPAPLLGITAATMTLSKTVLYWLVEYYCGFCAIGHNTWKDLIVYWIIPNGFWLVVPSLIIWRLSKDVSAALKSTQVAERKAASGKVL